MEPCIAICLQDDNAIHAFSDCTTIAVYQKESGWLRTDQFGVTISGASNLRQLREEIHRMIGRLGSCRVIAGSGLGGIAFGEFDKAGFSIFDITEYNDTVLDGIMEDLRQAQEEHERQVRQMNRTQPVETDVPGIYSFNLTAAQNEHPELSSKMLLGDFLSSTPFLELRLTCAHLPPWLERSGYDVTPYQSSDGTVSAVVTKKQC